jgi:hypothetical protein
MRNSQCPICFTPLEVRDTTPCYCCGAWPESISRLNSSMPFTEYRLPAGAPIVLCGTCVLEEFMALGGWGFQIIPDKNYPADRLTPVRVIANPGIGQDKFCPTCNQRLALLKIIAVTSQPNPPRTIDF